MDVGVYHPHQQEGRDEEEPNCEEDGDGSDDDVFDAIGETLIHELGHHFGMTEEEIDVVEEIWRRDALKQDEREPR